MKKESERAIIEQNAQIFLYLTYILAFYKITCSIQKPGKSSNRINMKETHWQFVIVFGFQNQITHQSKMLR